MIPAETLRKIARQILTKARAGQVVWQREEVVGPLGLTGQYVSGQHPFEYVLLLPQSQIRLQQFVSATVPDHIVMRVCDRNGTEFGRWVEWEEEDDWQLLSDLYAD